MAKFISKYLSLKLVNRATYTKEVEGRIVVVPGSSIRFDNGVYETKDKDEIAFLENHPNFGSVFVRVDTKEIEEAKKKLGETLEEREGAEAKTKEEKELKEKALEEGAEVPKKKGRPKKAEKPKF